MKKISIFLAFILGFLALVLPVAPALAAELDQSNQAGPATDKNIHSRDFIGQTFIPTMPTLDYIQLYLGLGENRHLSSQLVRMSTGAAVATGGQTISSDWGWRSVIGRATVAPGETYMIKVTATEGNIFWRSGANGYPSGMAYTPGAEASIDMWFKTYGTPGEAGASPGASISSSSRPGSSSTSISPTSSSDSSATSNKDKKVFGFLDFNGSIWKSWSFWALMALGVAFIGMIIWYFIDRAKKKSKLKGKDIKSNIRK